MTSFKKFMHGQKKKTQKNIPVAINTCCHYSFTFSKFFHQNKLLPLSSANPKKLSPLGAHLSCELLFSMLRRFSISTKKGKKVAAALSVENHELLWALSDNESREIINFLVKVFKLQHMGTFVYKILSLPLSKLTYHIHLKLRSFYLASYYLLNPYFCLKRGFLRRYT